jgi:hypothetical protein
MVVAVACPANVITGAAALERLQQQQGGRRGLSPDSSRLRSASVSPSLSSTDSENTIVSIESVVDTSRCE